MVGLAVAFGAAVLSGFLAALMGSKSGEIAGALGGLIGGIVGAGGAILAVFLTLDRQRNDEIANVTSAVQTEVRATIKFVIGAIGICEDVVRGAKSIPQRDANYIVKSLPHPPIVYPAVADRVGLLPYADATVEFYVRLNEARARIGALATAAAPLGEPGAGALVTAEFAKIIADGLLLALFVARPIIAERSQLATNPQLENIVRTETLRQIDDYLSLVHNWFPEARVVVGPFGGGMPGG